MPSPLCVDEGEDPYPLETNFDKLSGGAAMIALGVNDIDNFFRWGASVPVQIIEIDIHGPDGDKKINVLEVVPKPINNNPDKR
jgi:hypothetical protein